MTLILTNETLRGKKKKKKKKTVPACLIQKIEVQNERDKPLQIEAKEAKVPL